VTTLLSQAGIAASPAYVADLVNAVVAILNAVPAPASAVSPAASPSK
jgi:hypothetical protein